MAGKEQIKWPPRADLEAVLDASTGLEGKNGAAVKLGVSAPGLRHHCKKIGIDLPRPAWQRAVKATPPPVTPTGPRVEVLGDVARIATEQVVRLGKIEDMIRDAGLDPAEWDVDHSKLNKWQALARGGDDPEVVWLHQLTATLKRKAPLDWLFPASDVKPRPAPKPRLDPERPQVVVFLPDPHCPYHDRELDKRVDQLLHDLQPDRVVSPGDVCDFSSISRHRDNPAWFAQVQENIQAAYEWWAAKRAAAPDAEMDWVEGNHDARIRTELLTRAERMYGIKPAQIPGEGPEEDALSLRRLLHLDRLHVRFHGPPQSGDEYHHGHLDLAPGLCARHGWLTGAKSAENTMERLGMNVLFGHTHHRRVHYRTRYRGAEPAGVTLGIELGTLAQVRGGLGYAANPDWQQGGLVARIFKDGAFTWDFFEFDGRRMVWRDKRF